MTTSCLPRVRPVPFRSARIGETSNRISFFRETRLRSHRPFKLQNRNRTNPETVVFTQKLFRDFKAIEFLLLRDLPCRDHILASRDRVDSC